MNRPAPRRSSVALVLAFVLGTLLTVVPGASAVAVTVPFAQPGEQPLRLTGGVAQFQGGIAVPTRWSSFEGKVRLKWRGADDLVAGSGVRVSIGGEVVGETTVEPGTGAVTFTIPRRQLVKRATSIPVTIEARLKIRRTQCPGPDDLAAYVQFSQDSGLVLDGTWSTTKPTLKDFPKEMVTTVGRKGSGLLVRFPQKPTPEVIGAAAVAAGEIAASAGDAGVKVRVSQPGAELEPSAFESVLTVSATSGPGKLAIAGSTGRPARLSISGAADQLVTAAGGLRPSVTRTLTGTSSTKLPKIEIVRKPLPRRIQLPSGEFEGYGSGQVGLRFDLPVWREALRGARLRLSASYDAPAGGRAEIAINDRGLYTETLRRNGSSRFDVEEQLAGRGPALYRADLRAGSNQVSINADLAYPPFRCTTPDQTGRISADDFGSITLLTRARPVLATLSTLPFPFNRKPGWEGSTVQVPTEPTGPEIASIIGFLAEARRVTNEPAMPTIRIADDVPKGSAFILAREGAVPAELVENVTGPKENGVLAASSGGGDIVRVVAIGRRAMTPLASEYSIGKIQGRAVEVVGGDDIAIRVNDAQRVTGVERGATSWRWPLIVVAVAVLVLTLLGLRGAVRRVRRTDA